MVVLAIDLDRQDGFRSNRPVVLIVDDDKVARAVTAAALTSEGFSVLQADGAASALEYLGQRLVDAVVVDHVMPDMNGLELTNLIRDGQQGLLPILFLSADDRPETRVAALRAGASDFMLKSVDLEEVGARVVAHIRTSSEWRSRVSALELRTRTVARMAAVTPQVDPLTAAQMICETVSEAHGGRSCALMGWRPNQTLFVVGSAGRWQAVPVDQPALAARALSEPGAWIHHLGGDYPSCETDMAACAPLRRGKAVVGVLAMATTATEQVEALAAISDYASTASLQIGAPLGDVYSRGRRRETVREVLSGGGFRPAFQPIVDLRSGAVVGYEALTRLESGEPILQFLAAAEAAGLRDECELALLRGAVGRAGEVGDRWLSVNLSPSVITSHLEALAEVLRETRTEIVIELTENEPIDDYPAVREALIRLGPNVKLSVDDAGSGYASLRHVVDLRPQFMKLDRTWINGIDDDRLRRAMVAGLVAFCRESGTSMIAEGIETQEERGALEALGVRYGQGYLLGRPEPV